MEFKFLKNKLRNVAVFVFVISLTFILYQITFVSMIDDSSDSIVGNNVQKIILKPKLEAILNSNKSFKCKTGMEIDFSKFNDDYCDCDDGSDEPRTNACVDSEFLCWHKSKIVKIPSGWVNDGICDCCDGSDEYASIKSPINLDSSVQKAIGQYMTPCSNRCLT